MAESQRAPEYEIFGDIDDLLNSAVVQDPGVFYMDDMNQYVQGVDTLPASFTEGQGGVFTSEATSRAGVVVLPTIGGWNVVTSSSSSSYQEPMTTAAPPGSPLCSPTSFPSSSTSVGSPTGSAGFGNSEGGIRRSRRRRGSAVSTICMNGSAGESEREADSPTIQNLDDSFTSIPSSHSSSPAYQMNEGATGDDDNNPDPTDQDPLNREYETTNARPARNTRGRRAARTSNNTYRAPSRSGFSSNSGHRCPDCGKILKTKQSLDNHLKCIHGKLGGKKFKCCLCPSDYVQKGQLDNHMLLKHKGRKELCPVCRTWMTLGPWNVGNTGHEDHLGESIDLCGCGNFGQITGFPAYPRVAVEPARRASSVRRQRSEELVKNPLFKWISGAQAKSKRQRGSFETAYAKQQSYRSTRRSGTYYKEHYEVITIKDEMADIKREI